MVPSVWNPTGSPRLFYKKMKMVKLSWEIRFWSLGLGKIQPGFWIFSVFQRPVFGHSLYYLIDWSSDNGSECAKYEPDRRWNERQPDEVDVVVDGVQNAGQQKPQRRPKARDGERRYAACKKVGLFGLKDGKAIALEWYTVEGQKPDVQNLESDKNRMQSWL